MKNIVNKKTRLQLSLIIIWLLAGSAISYAQSTHGKKSPSLDNICRIHDAGSFIFFKEELKINPNTIFETYKNNFGLQQDDEMQLHCMQEQNKAGVTIYRYQQYHNGIKVHGAVMNIFEKDGIAQKANGRLIRNLDKSTAQLRAADALQIALQNINPEEYGWTDPVLISKFQNEKKLAGKKLEPNPELVYMHRRKSERIAFDNSVYELCWDIKLNLKHGASKNVFINAVDGKLVNELPLTLNCYSNFEFTLPFNSAQAVLCGYGGNDCTPYGNLEQFICDDYGSLAIETQDYDNSSPICFDVNSFDPLVVTGITADGAQVQWGLQKSLDYYWETFNWRSYDGDYGDLDGYVDFSFSDNNGNNASYDYWEDFNFGYGSSKENEFDSWTCLDIVGHEFTHGVDEYSADLDYEDESGALDESYADIAGEIIETSEESYPNYSATAFNWLVAGDKSTGYIRNMSFPPDKQQPDTYKGGFWCFTSDDNGGVHINSGVQNFMFYLLVAGGSGVNDNGTSYHVTPIDVNDAEYIAFHSHTYLWSSAEYSDARDAWIQAAIDLFGNCSQQAISVGEAWRAVGVGLSEYGYDQNLCGYIPLGTWQAINNITTNGPNCNLNAMPVLGNIYLVAGNQVIFSPGTVLTAMGSNIINAFINPCNLTIHDKSSSESLPGSNENTDKGVEENMILVYPNPASNHITVKIPGTDSHTTLKIYNNMMQVIRTMNFQNGTEHEIETNDLPAGIYFIEASAGRRSNIAKLVISR